MNRPTVMTCLSLLLVAGCQTAPFSEAPPPPDIKNHAVGHWTNKYPDNPDLAGVRVQQFPDCMYDAPDYEGRHPAMVIYLFKDGRANQIEYGADGTVKADWWWKAAPDDGLWKAIQPMPTTQPSKTSAESPADRVRGGSRSFDLSPEAKELERLETAVMNSGHQPWRLDRMATAQSALACVLMKEYGISNERASELTGEASQWSISRDVPGRWQVHWKSGGVCADLELSNSKPDTEVGVWYCRRVEIHGMPK